MAYVTHRENEAHKRAHGTAPIGELNGNSYLLGWQVAEIKYLLAHGIPQAKVAALFDLSPQMVNAIAVERSWADTPARTDVPALVGRVRALEAEVARLRAYLKQATLIDMPDPPMVLPNAPHP